MFNFQRELNTDIYLASADHQFILLSYDVELVAMQSLCCMMCVTIL